MDNVTASKTLNAIFSKLKNAASFVLAYEASYIKIKITLFLDN